MAAYPVALLPFNFRRLSETDLVGISASGDHRFFSNDLLESLADGTFARDLDLVADLKAKFFIGNASNAGQARLLASRIAAKHETVAAGPSLHIFVITLHCEHSCPYCQVSRATSGEGYTIAVDDLDRACDTIFQSKSPTLTVEFQGGDPLLRFDLIQHAIERIEALNLSHGRNIRYVIASTLHQLTPEMCAYLKERKVFLSTSIDGPAKLHNRNRPTPSGDSFERTSRGISMARSLVNAECVSALMTTTRSSLDYPEDIVDTYVALGLQDIFIRPISPYGFATRSRAKTGYERNDFYAFYKRALHQVLAWNSRGVRIREVWASIALNKMLSSFDGGYVDLQKPTGAGLATLVYNFDGRVYPSDEARMLAAVGDESLAMGRIGEPLRDLLHSSAQTALVSAALQGAEGECKTCAYKVYCGPDPVAAYAQCGMYTAPPSRTTHCQDSLWLFDYLFSLLLRGDPQLVGIARHWARPPGQ